jgi:two-component system, LytTR family, sensor kinase
MIIKSISMPFYSDHRVKLLLKFFFIGGGILTLLTLLSMQNPTMTDVLKYGFLNGFAFSILGFGNSLLTDSIDKFLPWTKNIPLRLVVSITSTIVYSAIAWVLIIWVWVIVTEGTVLSFSALIKIIPKNLNSLIMSLCITFFVSTLMHGRSFLINWRSTLVEAERLKKERVEAQYETLKNQVNPHFLFNSLNVLTTLVHKDADLAEQFIKQLAHNYRYILDTREREVVSIEEEINNLEAYIFLMKIRFGESLKCHIDVNFNGQIAPLTLQMLVENALKHNEISKAHPLSIDVFLAENKEYIVVKNNLQKKNNVADSTGVGLENIKSGYKFLSDKEVIINQDNDFFIVNIPIIA